MNIFNGLELWKLFMFKYLIGSFLIVTSIFLFPSHSPIKAATTHVLISEIQTSGDTPNHNATDEFVELYNPTDSDVNLDGWVIKRKDSGGNLRTLQILSGTAHSRGYFLIANPYYNGTVIPDNLYASASAGIADNNVVILYQADGITEIDKVGFGSPSDSETTPYPANPPPNGSIERISNIDTDNNLADFQILTTSDPQNSSFVEETPIPTPTESPTPIPTETPTPSPTETPTPSPTISPTSSPIPTNQPPGWSKSPIFTCQNNHVPDFVYTLLKSLMPRKFNCLNS